MKFKCGDRVRLVIQGLMYSHYEEWLRINAPTYFELWQKSCEERAMRDLNSFGSQGVVVAVGDHSSLSGDQVCLVEFLGVKDKYNEELLGLEVFEMVCAEGLEKIEVEKS